MIPDWFDIDEYICSKHFDQSQWLYEFEIRKMFYEIDMRSNLSPSEFGYKSLVADGGTASMQRISDLQTITTEIAEIVERVGDDIVLICPAWDYSHRRNLLTKSTNQSRPVTRITDPEHAQQITKLALPYEPVLSINLLHKNVDITNSIKQFIEDCRAELLEHPYEGPTPRPQQIGDVQVMSQSRLQLFYSCGLLPYFDLTQWARLSGVPISKELLGEAIFTKNYQTAANPGKTIRDTTARVHAREVLKNIELLNAQADFRWLLAGNESLPS